MIVPRTPTIRSLAAAACLVAGFAACAPLGMTLPSDELAPPTPDGSRIKPAVGWLTTQRSEIAGGAPEGSIAISIVTIGGHKMLQQVRHYLVGKAEYADSILLDRNSLKPVETWRWTPAGVHIARYNHRVIERTFKPVKGSPSVRNETLDVEPYSALGMELLVASLPLNTANSPTLIPVAVDTAQRGWAWLKCSVHSEQAIQERRDMKGFDVWIVICENGPGPVGLERTRLWIAQDGRSVRKIEHIDNDNVVLSTVRRMLLGIPQKKADD